MLNLAIYGFGSVYTLLLGFTMYASIIQAWPRLKIGIKILLAPVLVVFGGADMLFNFTFGSAIFFERAKTYTFSQRLNQHLTDTDWRGKVANAFAVPLNAIYPDHIHPNL